jgi:hypothetical protein
MGFQRIATTVAVAGLCACGGGGGGGTTGPPTGPNNVVAVGGDYTMAVALTENTCGAVTVLPLPTRVEHTPGTTDFRLTHGPNTWSGTLSAGGSFATETRSLPDGAGGSVAIRIEGRFLTTGLDALATVNAQPAAQPSCRYVVRWTGTKQGTPNVIP